MEGYRGGLFTHLQVAAMAELRADAAKAQTAAVEFEAVAAAASATAYRYSLPEYSRLASEKSAAAATAAKEVEASAAAMQAEIDKSKRRVAGAKEDLKVRLSIANTLYRNQSEACI